VIVVHELLTTEDTEKTKTLFRGGLMPALRNRWFLPFVVLNIFSVSSVVNTELVVDELVPLHSLVLVFFSHQ
jgi:hypothetical protein